MSATSSKPSIPTQPVHILVVSSTVDTNEDCAAGPKSVDVTPDIVRANLLISNVDDALAVSAKVGALVGPEVKNGTKSINKNKLPFPFTIKQPSPQIKGHGSLNRIPGQIMGHGSLIRPPIIKTIKAIKKEITPSDLSPFSDFQYAIEPSVLKDAKQDYNAIIMTLFNHRPSVEKGTTIKICSKTAKDKIAPVNDIEATMKSLLLG